MNFDWKAVVRTVAPTLASAFGTPLAGMAASAILNAILPADAPKPVDADAYLAQTLATATPEMLLQIKTAEQKFTVDLKTLGVDIERLGNEDRANARASAVATHDLWTPRILAYLLTAGFFSVMAMLILKGMPEGSKEALYIMIGSLGTAWIGSMTYYHGSSAGSAAKDMMQRLAPTKG